MAQTLLETTNQISPYNHIVELPKEVELAVRTDGKKEYLFILNYKNIELDIKVKKPLLELTSSKIFEGATTLKPYDVKILKY